MRPSEAVFRTALKSILARPFRLLTSGIAVLMGVAFMAGTLVLTDTIGQTFDDLFADVNRGTDAFVRADGEVEGGFGAEDARGTIDEALLDEVRTVDGVAEAVGEITRFAQIVGADGEPIGNPGQGPPTFGSVWDDSEALNPFRLDEGEGPDAANEVVIDKRSADQGNLAIGAQTAVLTQSGPVPVTVVGIAKFGTADSPGGASFALFEISFAQQVLARPGRLDAIRVAASDGVSEQELVRRLQDVVPADVEVLTGEEITKEDQDDIAEALSFFNGFLVAFAAIALFVGAFIIYNTFSILVAQRTREHALLRAVGASRRQVLAAVSMESVATGVVASGVGVVAGLVVAAGLKGLLAGFGVDIPASGLTVEPGSLITAFLVGLAITVLAALGPARRAGSVAPLAAVRDVAVDRAGTSRRRVVVGLAITAIGVAFLLGGLLGWFPNLTFAGLGAMVAFVGVAVLGPVLVAPVIGGVGRPVRRWRGVPGDLAVRNALRTPRRTSSTAAALMIGVGIVSFITVMAASVKASVADLVDASFQGDLVVSTDAQGFGGVSPSLAGELEALPEVEAAGGFRFTPVELEGESTGLVGVPPAVEQLFDLDVIEGDLGTLGPNELAIHPDARDGDFQLGDTVTLRFADTGDQQFTIAALYDDDTIIGRYVVSLAAFDAHVPSSLDFQVLVNTADGVNEADAKAAVEQVVAAYANAEVQDPGEFADSQQAQINQLLGLIYVMLALAIVIALVGIGNTLALAIHERTRELGLMRAVGMTRAQLRSSVRWESVLISTFGALLGMALGVVLGIALWEALSSEGFDRLAVPPGQLVLILVIAAAAGMAASLRPARRAAKLDVLAAIFDE